MEKQHTTKINLNEVKIFDLEGNEITINDFSRTLGNDLFKTADTIELSDTARLIHKGEPAIVAAEVLTEIIMILERRIVAYKAFIQTALLNYFNAKLEELK